MKLKWRLTKLRYTSWTLIEIKLSSCGNNYDIIVDKAQTKVRFAGSNDLLQADIIKLFRYG